MSLAINLKKFLVIIFAGVALTACATQVKKQTGMMQGDVYTGTETVEYLATGVKDRVFFATNKSVLTTASRDTLRKQAAYMRKQGDLTFSIEGHADERGTREYNLALGEKRAQAVKNYLNGLAVFPVINTLSYGKERPAVVGSNEGAWSQNRRSVTKVN